MWGVPGSRLGFSCSAAQPEPRLAASPGPLGSEPGPVNAAPAPTSRTRRRAPENIPSPLPTPHPPPRQGPPRPAGGTRRRRLEEEWAPPRLGWSWAAAVRTAGWRLPRPGPAAPAPPNPGTNQACESPAPRAAPARALQPPRPHAAPQAPGSGGPAASSRPGPAPLLPAARRPGARLGGSPRELASSSLRPPTYLPRMGGGGAGVPSSSRSSAAGRVGREATPRGGRGGGCPRLGSGLTGRDRWALLRGLRARSERRGGRGRDWRNPQPARQQLH